MSETTLEVYRAFREAQNRYTYFLLATGAAIGLAVNQTMNAILARSQVPLAGAVLSWGLSFFLWLPPPRIRELEPVRELGTLAS